jgi:hypothetical protein
MRLVMPDPDRYRLGAGGEDIAGRPHRPRPSIGVALLPPLLSSLNVQREHVLGILDGLAAQALRRRMLPSGWTCLGLVRHLAIDVARF